MPGTPRPPEGYHARPARPDDAPALAALFGAVDAAEGLDEVLGAEGTRRELAQTGADRSRHALVVLDPGGEVRGFAWAWLKQSGDSTRAILWVEAHPEHTGLEPFLIAWAEAAARPGPGAPGGGGRRYARLHIEEHRERRRRVAEEAGYRHVRTFLEMWRPLTGELPPPAPLPPGIALVPWSPDLAEGARLAVNEAFASHWDAMPVTPEDWHARTVDDPTFRPDLSRLAVDAGRVVALATASADPEQNARRGVAEVWVERVGTVPGYQRRGLATSLVSRVLHAAAAAGFTRAGLGVDQDNTTRATALYERLGFTVTRRSLAYVKELG